MRLVRTMTAMFAALLLAGLLIAPAAAQESDAELEYPDGVIDDGDEIIDDDVAVEPDAEEKPAEPVTPLARTGADVTTIIVAGLLLAVVGGGVLVVEGRRRRTGAGV